MQNKYFESFGSEPAPLPPLFFCAICLSFLKLGCDSDYCTTTLFFFTGTTSGVVSVGFACVGDSLLKKKTPKAMQTRRMHI
jgi:hypothetical protein